MARASSSDALAEYNAKRRFESTPEPKGKASRRSQGHLYTIQKHAARRLHYDLRLELDGVLKSWAVTRGPSLNPADKRLAVRTEDHPVEYAEFEGVIPQGNYGAGTVLLWDRGTWEPIGDPHEGLEKGKLVFQLSGQRLTGRWALVRFKGEKNSKRENWLLIKERDEVADPAVDVTGDNTDSVASGRDLEAIAAVPEAAWTGSSEKEKEQKKAGSGGRVKGRKSRKTELPSFHLPTLATLTDALPEGKGWLFEVKLDGYRALAAVNGKDVRIYTRNGLDWTHRYPAIADALEDMDLPAVLLDGEITVFDETGRSDFGALQQALKGGGGQRLSYFVFDLLEEDGEDLTRKPLLERKKRLQALLGEAGRRGPMFYTDHVEGHGGEMYEVLCQRGFEGVIAKRADAPYRAGRGRAWLKVKCERKQEFVIVGWSPSTRSRPFSSILLGQYEGGELRYAGKVGTGFSDDELASLSRRFAKLASRTPTVKAPRAVARTARWVRPELVAQIEFSEFTKDGLVRQGRFLGLREDKPARAVERERPEPLRRAAAAAAPAKKVAGKAEDGPTKVAGVTLTHPDKALFPEQGVTKRDLADYLYSVSDRMMPHVAKRLLTFVRCPQGQSKECFYQRHGGRGVPEQFHQLAVEEMGGKQRQRYLYIEEASGLVAAAQLGVLELHIWGSRIDRVDRPDRVVFDLDPDPELAFDEVKRGATRLRDVLGALDLESFPLLTGGKGVHVVVPIQRRHDWAAVKGFARAVSERMVEDAPDRYVATMTKKRRTGRVFIDFFRNDRTATAVAPYSPRAREGAPLAWPVTWEGLAKAPAANCVRLGDAAERLRERDPWAGYEKVNQALKAAAFSALGL